MLSLITPENLPEILIALAAIITAAGGVTLYRVQKEPPKPGSHDAAAIAIAENTKALTDMADQLGAQNAHFGDNNDMFRALGPVLSAMAKDFAEARKEMTLAREHLAAIREQGNRRAR